MIDHRFIQVMEMAAKFNTAIICICTKRDMYPDGREFVGTGTVPAAEIEPYAANVINDNDVVLQKPLKCSAKNRRN